MTSVSDLPAPKDENDPVLRSVAASLPPSSAILDLGCGPGRDLRIFSECGHRPIGLELNPDFVTMARQFGDVVDGDLRQVASFFEPESFTGIWAQASLVHLGVDAVRGVLDELHRLLVPGGQFYACVSATGSTGWLDEPDGRRWYTVWAEESFPNAVSAAGFVVTEVGHGSYVEVWAERP